jgi:hypothetical protein
MSEREHGAEGVDAEGWPQPRQADGLLDIGDVLIYRCRRDKVLLAERRLHATTVEMTFGAISLDAARCAGKTGTGVSL